MQKLSTIHFFCRDSPKKLVIILKIIHFFFIFPFLKIVISLLYPQTLLPVLLIQKDNRHPNGCLHQKINIKSVGIDTLASKKLFIYPIRIFLIVHSHSFQSIFFSFLSPDNIWLPGVAARHAGEYTLPASACSKQ